MLVSSTESCFDMSVMGGHDVMSYRSSTERPLGVSKQSGLSTMTVMTVAIDVQIPGSEKWA